MKDQANSSRCIEVCFSPKLFSEIQTKENFIVVLVDILRATTSICAAFDNGVRNIIPVATLEEAKSMKEQGFMVASEQDGKKLDFADFGNSAFNFSREAIGGKTLVYCTTNGTRALETARKAEKIAIGAFINLSALTNWLNTQEKNVVILCSGWKNKFCLEDTIFAGALVEKLLNHPGFVTHCDSAAAALDLWHLARPDILNYIEKAAHRHRLKKLELDDVIPYSFMLDQTKVVPVFEGKEIVNVAGKTGNERGMEDFTFLAEQFADAKILRYQVPGFEKLDLKQKKLVYYLSQAALCGRDIIYDQNYKYNLLIRKTLEAIYIDYSGDRNNEAFKKFEVHLKRVWFCNGIHHHYSTDKFFPEFTQVYFAELLKGTNPALLPLSPGQDQEQFLSEISPLLFSPETAPKRVCLDPSKDLVLSSASNFYAEVNQAEVETFYANLKQEAKNNRKDARVSFGLNSRLVKENGTIVEEIYRVGGSYSPAIEQIVYWLEHALSVTETREQHAVVKKLIGFYKTGSLADWDAYNIAWVKDLNSLVDFVNGFIEVYGDPMAIKGSWESIVNFKDVEASRRPQILSDNAQYFEDHSPVDPGFRKKVVKGVSAKVITVAQLGGECDPTTPIGINLPNANWIRKEHGSKSVTIDNITYAYDQASQGNGFLEEFVYSSEEIERSRTYGHLAGNLTTDLHECLGHGSGQLKRGVEADALKNYHSTIEEARADLFALYYIKDPELVNLGLVENYEVAKAAYDNFIRNGLMTQLVRIQPGKSIEESHMRDRALIAHWIFENSRDKKIIEKMTKEGKTYFRINDYDSLRWQFGELLKIIQRITSEGDYKAAKELVERYAVQVDPVLHQEVLARYAKLNIAPYAGFINPEYSLVMKGETITDVKISYPDDFATQMMHYSKKYSFLQAR